MLLPVMKAAIMKGINRMSVENVTLPDLEDDQVLIRIAYCGICATDYDNFTGTSSFAKENKLQFPLRWGHEWSGRVCAAGKGVKNFNIGDRVVSEGKITCGTCTECKANRQYNCLNKRTIGTVGNAWPGGMSEYIIVPERNLIKLGENVSFRTAAAMEPASIAMNGLRDLPLANHTLLITGSGPIGLSAIPIARALGAKNIMIAARKKTKLDIARSFGVDHIINTTETDLYEEVSHLTTGTGADVVLETSGEASFVENMARLVRVGGCFSSISFYNRLISNLNMDDIVYNKIDIFGRCGSHDCVPILLQMINDGEINIDPIITSEIDFYEHGIDCMQHYEAIKDSNVKMLVKVFGEDA